MFVVVYELRNGDDKMIEFDEQYWEGFKDGMDFTFKKIKKFNEENQK